jgi:hypothetical protein
MVLADKGYRVPLGALEAHETFDPGLFKASGVRLADGSLLIVGGSADSQGAGESSRARIYR